jgi:hypothetical protein
VDRTSPPTGCRPETGEPLGVPRGPHRTTLFIGLTGPKDHTSHSFARVLSRRYRPSAVATRFVHGSSTTPTRRRYQAVQDLHHLRHCRYPTDLVSPRACFKPRQKARYVSTRRHVPPRYQNPPSYLGRAPTLSCFQGSRPLPSA